MGSDRPFFLVFILSGDGRMMESSPSHLSGGGGGGSGPPSGEFSGGAGEHHGALFLVLGYLRLPELLCAQRACRSFRDAVAGDSLLWRDVRVEPPLSGKLTDDGLLEVTSRSGGRLRSLTLVDCWRVTDAALQRVVDENPDIVKINVPGCTRLTADGVVGLVTSLAEQQQKKKNKKEKRENKDKEEEKRSLLVQLGVYGIPHLGKDHLNVLRSLLPPPVDGGTGGGAEGHAIDVDVCPRCDAVRIVLDCTRERCRTASVGRAACRGCGFCIVRCEECGGCVEGAGEESACSHTLCLSCWLRLPKCSLCNRPFCSGHRRPPPANLPSSNFTCDQCSDPLSSLDLTL